MADYDNWDHSCCGGFPGHKNNCDNHPVYGQKNIRERERDAKWRPQGLIYDRNTGYFMCRRGCGTVVHSPEEHIKNVCTKFQPLVAASIPKKPLKCPYKGKHQSSGVCREDGDMCGICGWTL